MPVPLLDLEITHRPLAAALEAALARVVQSQAFILGPEVDALEAEVLAFIDAPRRVAVGCASGSDALILAFRALGIGPGDEVVVPAFSFTSTATSVDVCGARPVFVDVEGASLNIDPAKVSAALTAKTRAVVAVHLFGRPADVPAVRAALDAAGRPDVAIVEDAAQALGARVDGVAVGALAELATLSFFPTKNLGCFGDGGMVIARDPAAGETLRLLRAHGAREKYKAELIGYNSRLDAIQAAVLRTKLPSLRAWCDARRDNAAAYRHAFAAAGLIGSVQLPADDGPAGRFHHIYNQFVLRVPRRGLLLRALAQRGIGAAVYYPRTLPQQPCYSAHAHVDADFPVASAAAADALAIPIYPGLTAAQRSEVVDAIRAFFDGDAPAAPSARAGR